MSCNKELRLPIIEAWPTARILQMPKKLFLRSLWFHDATKPTIPKLSKINPEAKITWARASLVWQPLNRLQIPELPNYWQGNQIYQTWISWTKIFRSPFLWSTTLKRYPNRPKMIMFSSFRPVCVLLPSLLEPQTALERPRICPRWNVGALLHRRSNTKPKW